MHALTSGNHIWDKREVIDFIDDEPRLLRPANYPAGAPGAGSYVFTRARRRDVGVINVMGRIFLATIDDPFAAAAAEIARMRDGRRACHPCRFSRRGHVRKDRLRLAF